MVKRIWSFLCKLSCGHIRSQDNPPNVGDQEWCNYCGDFKTVTKA